MYGQRAVGIQPYDDVAAPGGVVALGVVLAPVTAPGLLAPLGGGDQDAGHAQEVGGLPGVDAGLGGLAVLVEGVTGVAVQPLELSGGPGEGVGGAQDARALGHDPLDREAGLGGEQRVRGLLGVRDRLGHARVEGVLGLAPGDVRDDPLGVDEAFEKGVGGEPVRAVHAGAGDLSARVQAGDGRTAPGVGADAAGGVVGGRGDRHGLGDRVDAVAAAGGEDRREAVLPHVGAEVPGVQEHVLGVLLLHAPHDALGDDVPGRQLGQFVLAQHEAHAVGVDQVGTLAAHRLGDQGLLALRVGAEEQHGGVELHELQVGDLGARAEGEGDPVAGRHGRVGGRREDLPHATRREDHGGRVHGAHTVVLALAHDVQGDARGTALGVRQKVQHERVLDRAQPTRVYGLDECPGDLRAGRVAAGVRDTAAVVAALAGQLQSSFGGLVEVGTGLDESSHGVGALGDEDPYGLLVAQARAGHQGVVQVLFGGVALPEGRGDAALGPAGGAVVEAGLGDDDRAQPGRLAAQGGGQAGHSGADDHHVRVDGPPGGGRVQSYACAGHEAAPRVPKASGMLSISRVVPTRAATARTASPVKSSSTSVKSEGSTRAR